jgi:hypothetical protein
MAEVTAGVLSHDECEMILAALKAGRCQAPWPDLEQPGKEFTFARDAARARVSRHET